MKYNEDKLEPDEKYITIKDKRVARTKGGIAFFKSFSLLKYIVKKTSRGPKSAINLIRFLRIRKCIHRYLVYVWILERKRRFS